MWLLTKGLERMAQRVTWLLTLTQGWEQACGAGLMMWLEAQQCTGCGPESLSTACPWTFQLAWQDSLRMHQTSLAKAQRGCHIWKNVDLAKAAEPGRQGGKTDSMPLMISAGGNSMWCTSTGQEATS